MTDESSAAIPPREPAAPAAAAGGTDPEQWVDRHGDYLFKYALLRLRDPGRAEDLVQETFLAALKGGSAFAGRAAEKTWLVGILKHKIFDYYRKLGRETSFTDLRFYESQEEEQFLPEPAGDGHWRTEMGPLEWPDTPGMALDQAAFWQAFHECRAKLPAKVGAVFCLREIDGLETPEICALLQISESNLWVMLHRARTALRRCLETQWFGRLAGPPTA